MNKTDEDRRMPTDGIIINLLSNHSFRKHEKEALETHERRQIVIPDAYVYDPEFGEEIIPRVVFIAGAG